MIEPRVLRATCAGAGALLLIGLSVTVGDNRAGVLGVALLAVGAVTALGALGMRNVTGSNARSSTVRSPATPAPGRPRGTRVACLAGGAVMLGGLALGQLHGVDPATAVEVSLAGLAGSAVVAAPDLVAGARRFGPLVLRAALVCLVLGAVAALVVLVRGALARFWPAAVLLAVAAAGLVLVADTLGAQVRPSTAPRGLRRPQVAAAEAGGRRYLSRGVLGALMVVWAGVLGIVLAGTRSSGHPWLVVVSAVVIVIAVVVLLGTPLLITSVAARRRHEIQGLLDADRQRISADLHDSVLQTLALVQRQATDAAAVARLARRQEHALRSWMAGEAELTSGSLAGALREVTAAVEDDLGLVVELSIIGDRSVQSGDDMLLAATREALRNVGRHAAGSVAHVFSEIGSGGVEVYVLDDGPGFVPDEVPSARRGIRDAIVGRMSAVGGSAEINTTVGQGTEVLLRLPGT